MGGPLWYVEKPKTLNPKSMLVGVDVFHHKNKDSCVGFVSSCDPKFSRYHS